MTCGISYPDKEYKALVISEKHLLYGHIIDVKESRYGAGEHEWVTIRAWIFGDYCRLAPEEIVRLYEPTYERI